MNRRTFGAIATLAMLAACGPKAPEPPPSPEASQSPAAPPAARREPVFPLPASPEDRTPLDERPQPPESAQGAATVVETYFGLIEAGRYDEAYRPWGDGGKASGMSAAAFAESFGKYAEYHAEVYAPGTIEGAAGSLHVTVPAKAYGRMKDGRPFTMEGPLTLRRVNDVPGSTPEQRRWHISASGLKPRPE